MKVKKPFFCLHYSFVILLVLSYFFGLLKLMILYFLCLFCHELCHAAAAKKLGYRIGRIKLLCTGAVLEAESDEFTFRDEVLIAISGPLFNLGASLVLLALWWLAPETYNHTQELLLINLSIFLFNLLPIYPLDGGRVLQACLSARLERQVAVRITKCVGLIFSLCLFALFIFSWFVKVNFSFGVMAIILFIGVISRDKDAAYKRLQLLGRKAERASKRGLEVRQIMVSEGTPPLKLFSMLDGRHYTIFVLVDSKLSPAKVLTESQLVEQLFSGDISKK